MCLETNSTGKEREFPFPTSKVNWMQRLIELTEDRKPEKSVLEGILGKQEAAESLGGWSIFVE